MILALETSARAVSAAIADDQRLLAWGYQDTGLTHSRTLMPIVAHLFENSAIQPRQIDLVAAAAGPGSFTGIRIGLAAAKGLAFSLEKPAVGVSTLAAMAHSAALFQGLVVCTMDARRQQVYNANFSAASGVLTRLTEDRALSLSQLAEELKAQPGPIVLVGDGAHLTRSALEERGIPCRLAPPHLLLQNAAGVAAAAREEALSGRAVSAQELQARYLRPPHAVPRQAPPPLQNAVSNLE